MLVSTNTLAVKPRYHKHSPLVWLIGCDIKGTVVVEGAEMMALVDIGCKSLPLLNGSAQNLG